MRKRKVRKRSYKHFVPPSVRVSCDVTVVFVLSLSIISRDDMCMWCVCVCVAFPVQVRAFSLTVIFPEGARMDAMPNSDVDPRN